MYRTEVIVVRAKGFSFPYWMGGQHWEPRSWSFYWAYRASLHAAEQQGGDMQQVD